MERADRRGRCPRSPASINCKRVALVRSVLSAPSVLETEEPGAPKGRRFVEMIFVVAAVLMVGTSLTLSVFFLGGPPPTPSFDFTLSLDPSSASVAPGGSVGATLTATLLSGSSRDVSYSCADLPFGDCSFTPSHCRLTCSTSLVLATSSSTPAGAHPVAVRASNGTFSKTVTFALTVTGPPLPLPFVFSLKVDPSSGTVAPGGSVSTNVTATLVSGSTRDVQFACSDLPTGIACTFAPPSCLPNCTAGLSISTSAGTPSGDHRVRVTASNGSFSRMGHYTLTVTTPPRVVTLTFQKGEGGAFSETDDAYIYAGAPDQNFGSELDLLVDDGNCIANGTICRSLLTFPDFIGPNPGQVAPGSAIISATLQLNVTDPSPTRGLQLLYQITEAWTEGTVTWNAFATPGMPGSKGPAITYNATTVGLITVNVTHLVHNWSQGDANHGAFVWSESWDGVDYGSSESTNPPKLTVTFRSVGPPVAASGSIVFPDAPSTEPAPWTLGGGFGVVGLKALGGTVVPALGEAVREAGRRPLSVPFSVLQAMTRFHV